VPTVEELNEVVLVFLTPMVTPNDARVGGRILNELLVESEEYEELPMVELSPIEGVPENELAVRFMTWASATELTPIAAPAAKAAFPAEE